MDYVDYATKQLEKLQEYAKLVRESDNLISPDMVNRALGEHQEVLFFLTAELIRIEREFLDFDREFQLWWDDKFIIAREKLNPLDLAGTKWASLKEIETYVRANNRKEWTEQKIKKDNIESKFLLMKRLVKQWESFESKLITLANNMRAEMRSLTVTARANASQKLKVSRTPVAN